MSTNIQKIPAAVRDRDEPVVIIERNGHTVIKRKIVSLSENSCAWGYHRVLGSPRGKDEETDHRESLTGSEKVFRMNVNHTK
jgi:hypothetical protein